MFGDDESARLERYRAEVLADQKEHGSDPFLGVRIVLLVATGISLFTMPWMVSCVLALAWVLVMVWPKNG